MAPASGTTVGGVAAGHAMTDFLRAHSRIRPRRALDRLFGAPVLTEVTRPHYQQVLAERAVADQLRGLSDDWIVLHALPIDSLHGNIDHVVIGPAGIFTLNSHHLVGRTVTAGHGGLHIDGHRENHIRDAEFDVGRVERRLAAAAGRPVGVIGVIVVVGARIGQLRGLPHDIAVLPVGELRQWLGSRPDSLDRDCVDQIAQVALQPGTWMPLASQPGFPPDLEPRFEAVRQVVDAATRTHRLWLVALSAAVLGFLGFATWGVALQAAMP